MRLVDGAHSPVTMASQAGLTSPVGLSLLAMYCSPRIPLRPRHEFAYATFFGMLKKGQPTLT